MKYTLERLEESIMESICNACAECARQECGCEDCPQSVTMNARVLRVCCCEMLVCDLCTCQEVLVHTSNACCFRPGQCVRITFNGAMTMSIPPQISADCVKPFNNGGNTCCC